MIVNAFFKSFLYFSFSTSSSIISVSLTSVRMTCSFVHDESQDRLRFISSPTLPFLREGLTEPRSLRCWASTSSTASATFPSSQPSTMMMGTCSADSPPSRRSVSRSREYFISKQIGSVKTLKIKQDRYNSFHLQQHQSCLLQVKERAVSLQE